MKRCYHGPLPPDTEIIRFPPPTPAELADTNAALEFAHWYTRAIIIDSRRSGPDLGVGNRLFVASAAHCIEHNPFVVMTCDPYTFPRHPTGFINRSRVPNRDIGFLEIEKDPNTPHLSVERLCPDPPVSNDPLNPSHRPTCVVGFPAHDFKRPPGHLRLGMTNYETYPVQVSEDEYQYTWPLVVGSYRQETDTVVERELNHAPSGYSGGGVWVCNEPPEGRLVLPDHLLTLYAIQSRYQPGERIVKCIPIRYWIKLVFDKYPDLRELLAEQFPFLRAVE